jgi:DNA-binding transcriptional MerR regulator
LASNFTYTPAELCDMLNISKSTLFRWEREGVLPSPTRDQSDQRHGRIYTQEHVQAIGQKQKEQFERQYEQASKDRSWDSRSLKDLLETNSLRKFLEGNDIGLRELREYDQLLPKTIRTLLQVTLEQCEPEDDIFYGIIQVVYEQSYKQYRIKKAKEAEYTQTEGVKASG